MAVKVRPSDEIVQENIKKWNIPQPDKEYTVLIHCTTYNHGQYIEDALKGFVMQKTNFPFCAIIIDDCSTDNNAEIIKSYAEKYPDIIKPILLGENHMQHGLLRDPYFEKWHQSAKYIAECEGDDYWIDPLKLQKQVDFLESHSDYLLACNSTYSFSVRKNKIVHKDFKISEDIDLLIDEVIMKGGLFIATCSFVYRKGARENYPEYCKECHAGDYPFQIWCALHGKIRCFHDIMSVYRVDNPNSWVGSSIEKRLSTNRMNGILSEVRMLQGYRNDFPNYYDNFSKRIIYL